MKVEENLEADESDENYIKSFQNWSPNKINEYHKIKYGNKKSPTSVWNFAILSRESVSEDKIDICSNDQLDGTFSIKRINIDLGSSCLVCVDLGTLDIEVSLCFFFCIFLERKYFINEMYQ